MGMNWLKKQLAKGEVVVASLQLISTIIIAIMVGIQATRDTNREEMKVEWEVTEFFFEQLRSKIETEEDIAKKQNTVTVLKEKVDNILKESTLHSYQKSMLELIAFKLIEFSPYDDYKISQTLIENIKNENKKSIQNHFNNITKNIDKFLQDTSKSKWYLFKIDIFYPNDNNDCRVQAIKIKDFLQKHTGTQIERDSQPSTKYYLKKGGNKILYHTEPIDETLAAEQLEALLHENKIMDETGEKAKVEEDLRINQTLRIKIDSIDETGKYENKISGNKSIITIALTDCPQQQ